MSFRKRRRPTPGFKVPNPFNPIQGGQANLRQDGLSPYCSMMQVAAEDIYENYVICRGFDTRILRFVDYAEGDDNKPGISVAKPFGNRVVGKYKIAEVYPALLPTQGNTEFTGFRQVTYTPPSPVAVEWRVGQNPGKVTGGGLDGGQPEELTDAIEILYDHNNKVINWLLLDSVRALRTLTGVATAVGTETSGDHDGLEYADLLVFESSDPLLIGTTVRVHDRKGCILDIDVTDYTVWAHELWAASMDTEKACDELVKFWAADDHCCDPDTAVYRECE